MGTCGRNPGDGAPNLLIEASAGTGKTQALAGRLIELIRAGLKPREIVALTFSRAAAGEIFERFVSLLAESAAENPGDAALLREVVATQHLSQIGTLDSFLMRMVRSFPLELGLRGDVDIMDDYTASVERARTSFAILRRSDASTKRAFVEAFSLAMNREDVRSFVQSYRKFIASWHEHVLAIPDPSAWGNPSAIWSEPPDYAGATGADLEAAAERVRGATNERLVLDFAEWVRSFRGVLADARGLAKKLLEKDDVFDGATIEVAFNRRKYAFGGEECAAIRHALRTVFGYILRQRMELAKGVYALISAYESEYAKKVRERGRLVFADVPRLITSLGADSRLALEYRMDAKIRAWALDEFQDTSREQWRALGPLIDEAKQSDGEKSVFVVGDRKQAIYGWRNGDVGIFTRERESGAYATGELKRTYRSGPAVVDAVNKIFVDGPLKDDFPAWESPVHETARPELGGFVQRIEASGARAEDFVEPVFNALAAVDPVKRGLATAVLVRTNTLGEFLAAELRARGLEGVVWEGESAIYDTPALSGFMDLVALADHPGDTHAYSHFVTTPVAKARFPEGVPEVGELSVIAARAFTTRGLVRVFRELRAKLPDDPSEAWSAFTESRFTDLLRAASEFELGMEPGVRLSDFATFVASRKKRNIAEPGRIRIMTIHRSKGLGFDWVVLPLYEHDAINAAAEGPLVGPGWILPDPGVKVTRSVPGLADAARARQERVEQEALCTWYVAMTRAKRAMTVVTQPAPKSGGESRRFSDYVRSSLPEEMGDREWYMSAPPKAGPGASAQARDGGEGGGQFRRPPRERISRRLPSQNFRSGMSAGELFDAQGPRDAAKRRGTAVHEALERMEWIDPAAPKDDLERRIAETPAWREAFVKPAGFAALWRERSFELLEGGRWTSGQFDRVVFTGEGDGRRAVVYDFKTNARRRGESDAAFAARLEAMYAGQMAAYRHAVSVLASIPPERVETRILSNLQA